MTQLKTRPNDNNVETFLSGISDAAKQQDYRYICQIMQEISAQPPKMWGSAIIGFGSYHYTYASGREGDWMLIGFSPRKSGLTLYIMDGYSKYQDLLDRLGKHSTGKSCLYIKSLADTNLAVLKELIHKSVIHMNKTYPKQKS